jgi:hypothetical protein
MARIKPMANGATAGLPEALISVIQARLARHRAEAAAILAVAHGRK